MNNNFKDLLKSYDTKLRNYILKINQLVLKQEIEVNFNELLNEFEIILNNFLDFLINLKTKTFISNEEYFLILNYLDSFNHLLSTELKELKEISNNNIEIKELLSYNTDLLQEYSNKFLFLINTVNKLSCLKEHSKLLNNLTSIKKNYLSLIKYNNNNTKVNVSSIKLKSIVPKNKKNSGFFKLYFLYTGIMLFIVFFSILGSKLLEKLLLLTTNS